jgi:DNA-binding NarL/FixJ family response regulator
MDTLLLVEDDTPTREWLRQILLESGSAGVVHACANLREARACLAQHRPDIVLTDLGLPDGNGLEVIKEAVARYPQCEILVLSIFGDERNVVAALDAGAGGYLLKDGSVENIRDHLACLRSGGSPLSPRIARTLINRHRAGQQAAQAPLTPPPTSHSWPGTMPPLVPRPAPSEGASGTGKAPPTLLSERELEVLTGVAKGFSYAEVAQMLGMSTNTVRTHIRRLYEKLSVNSRSEALIEYNRRMLEQGRPLIR